MLLLVFRIGQEEGSGCTGQEEEEEEDEFGSAGKSQEHHHTISKRLLPRNPTMAVAIGIQCWPGPLGNLNTPETPETPELFVGEQVGWAGLLALLVLGGWLLQKLQWKEFRRRLC